MFQSFSKARVAFFFLLERSDRTILGQGFGLREKSLL